MWIALLAVVDATDATGLIPFRAVPFNLYSIPDLAGFLISAAVAIVFYLRHFFLGRRRLDFVFATCVAGSAGTCLAIFLADNVVPANVLSSRVPHAAELTLSYARATTLLALASLTGFVHFTEWYWRGRGPSSWLVNTTYAVCIALSPLIWSNLFFLRKTEPASQYGSWSSTAPWWPDGGPLLLCFLVESLLFAVYCLWLLFKKGEPRRESASPSRSRAIPWALFVLVCGGIIDISLNSGGWTGIAVFPFSTVASNLMIATGLTLERRVIDGQQHQMQRELSLAASIQERLLSRARPAIAGFEICAWSKPASKVGGDTYDIFPLPDGRSMIMLADASGHGLAAALVIAETRAYIRAVAVHETDPSGILTHVQELLAPTLSGAQLVTCFVGLLDPATGELTYAAAGQGPILFVDGATGTVEREDADRVPLLNFVPDPQGETRIRQLRAGEILFVPSDGFWEARNHRGEQFGIARLTCFLETVRTEGAGIVGERAQAELGRFLLKLDATDDVTVIVVRRMPQPAASTEAVARQLSTSPSLK